MAQEVQTTLDYKAELNEIEGIGYQQRRVSDKMQVRDKTSNQVTALADTTSMMTEGEEAITPGWTLTSSGGIDYQPGGASLIVPLAGAYMLQYIPYTGYPQTTYYYTIRVYVDNVEQYSERLSLGDHETRSIVLNLGKRNKLKFGFTSEFNVIANIRPTIKLIKL